MPFVALLGSLAFAGFGLLAFGKWLESFNSAARLGLGGLLGLGSAGAATFVIGLLPNGFRWGWIPVVLMLLAGLPALFKELRGLKDAHKPQSVEYLAYLVLGVALLFAFVALLAPSTPNDWDSIAYHLAVPKIYLQSGSIQPVPYIHHSNFPSVVDIGFVWGLVIGGQAAAKALVLTYTVFGALAIKGLAHEAYGRAAGLWAMVAFVTVPVVLWESGTAYIDVAHGLFAGIGLVLAFRDLQGIEKPSYALSGIFLGLACASKYTGLQTLLVVLVVLGIIAVIQKRSFVPLGFIAVLSVGISAPWYAKNYLWTGNPTYPFFYEVFHGRNWDQKRADIYAEEQKAFGVGVTVQKRDWTKIGEAVLGLAFQPGRYINPGEADGLGWPLGAVGLAFFGGLLFWAIAKKPPAFEASLLACAFVSFVMWFALSQQSRYITTLVVPVSILVGGAVVQKEITGKVVAGLAALQVGITFFLEHRFVFDAASQVAFHKVDEDEFKKATLGSYYEATQTLNALPSGSKVALYDQVFGFYLDIPYVWANPPHSLLIPYESMKSGEDYVREMKQLGFTHIYIQFVDRLTDGEFRAALGIDAPILPLSPERKSAWQADWIQVWKVYLCDAVQKGLIVPTSAFGHSGIILEIKQG